MAENGLPQSGEFYKDKADGLYQVLLTAVNAIDRGSTVVYQELRGTYPVYVIPAELFRAGFTRVVLKQEGGATVRPQNAAQPASVSAAEECGTQYIRGVEGMYETACTNNLTGAESRAGAENLTDAESTAVTKSPAGAENLTDAENPAGSKSQAAAGSPAGFEERTAENGRSMRSAGSENRINSGLMDFLDARSYQEKLEILDGMRSSLNERVLNDIGMSLDISVDDKKSEEKYLVIRNYLKTQIRFEDRRLR